MKKFRLLAPVVGLLASATPVYAQLSVPRPGNMTVTNLGLMISNAIQIALIIAAILVFVFLVWGGLQWIMSGGDKAKTEEARNRITAALVGLAIVAAAWAVMAIVSNFFGISLDDGNELPSATTQQ